MESRRFDDMTRLLASTSSRRRALKLLAGGVVAGIAGRRGVGTVSGAAAPPRACSPDTQACLQTAQENLEAAVEVCNELLSDCTGDPNTHPAGCGAIFAICRRQARKAYEQEVGTCERTATQCDSPKVYNPDTCRCECAGQSCNPPRTVNPDTCQCECPTTFCPSPRTPDPSTCECACPAGTTECGGNCVTHCPEGRVHNPLTCACDCATCPPGQAPDPMTCACRCQVSCPPPTSPNPVTCACECPTGLTECNGTCVDTTSDPSNCGGCGIACASGETCTNGECGGCGEGLVSCLGQCQVPQPQNSPCDADSCCIQEDLINYPLGQICCGGLCRRADVICCPSDPFGACGPPGSGTCCDRAAGDSCQGCEGGIYYCANANGDLCEFYRRREAACGIPAPPQCG